LAQRPTCNAADRKNNKIFGNFSNFVDVRPPQVEHTPTCDSLGLRQLLSHVFVVFSLLYFCSWPQVEKHKHSKTEMKITRKKAFFV